MDESSLGIGRVNLRAQVSKTCQVPTLLTWWDMSLIYGGHAGQVLLDMVTGEVTVGVGVDVGDLLVRDHVLALEVSHVLLRLCTDA